MPIETLILDDAQQVRDWDAQTMREQKVSSLQLMERAAKAFVAYFTRRYPMMNYQRVDVLCGPGNNGGDGAAIARLLEEKGYQTSVWGWWSNPALRSSDLAVNWQRLADKDHPRLHVNEEYTYAAVPDVVVDALFGVGLTRPLEGAFAKTVHTLNDQELRPEATAIVSVDVPSGQHVNGSEPGWQCVNAHKTITFAALKTSALLPETGRAWGSIQVVSLDLPNPNWEVSTTPTVLQYAGLSSKGPKRRRFTHKGTYGHVLVIAGSRGHAGAALLCGQAAYRMGCGLVTFYCPQRLEPLLQGGLPEAMVLVDPAEDCLTTCPDLDKYDAIAVGPGIGQDPRTAAMLRELFVRVGDKPIVIDADALNLVAADEVLAKALPKRSILTPHPGEFERLAGTSANGFERLELLRSYARSLPSDDAVVVLKNQYTTLANKEGDLAFNFWYGNPGMATGGMGDTLTGAIASAAAQLFSQQTEEDYTDLFCWEAAGIAVLAHAKAGDMAAKDLGQAGLLASDVASGLGLALRELAD